MKFIVEISCPNCTGIDSEGCGEGKPWLFTDIDGKVILFDSESLAEEKAEAYTSCTVWKYQVKAVPDDFTGHLALPI